MTIKKSVKTTWKILEVNPGTPTFTRIAAVLTPTLITVGVFCFLTLFLPLWLAALFALAAGIGISTQMITNSKREEDFVDRMLSDKMPSEFRLPEDRLSRLTSDVRPDYYQGAGEWIALGHVDHRQFVEDIKVLDPFIETIDDPSLLAMVTNSYVINTYSPRNDRDAIRFVTADTPNSYPVTHLHVPYDHYINSGYPDPTYRVVPTPYLFENRMSRESL